MNLKKETLLKKLRYKRTQWDSTIDKIIKKGLENEIITKKWILKDIISHITWYEKELIKAIEDKTIAESEFWNMSYDERNELIYNETKEKTLEEILKESATINKILLEKIEKLSDEELNSDVFIKRKTNTRVTHNFIGGITFWHYEDHEDVLIDRFDLEFGFSTNNTN